MEIEEHIVESSSGDYVRKVWLLRAATSPSRLGVFLDGEFYLNKMDAPATLRELQRTRVIPPMTCAFVSHRDEVARHNDLTCNARFAEFIATDVVRWLRGKEEGLPVEGHLIAGISLSGLASAYLTLTRPTVFSHCLSHSGSFWWNDECSRCISVTSTKARALWDQRRR